MKAKRSGMRFGSLVMISAVVALGLFLAYLLYFKPKMGDILFEPVFVNDVKKIQLVSEMRVNLNASVEAEKSAVLADTDEASRAYADQALTLSAVVEKDREALGKLIEAEKMGREVDLFHEFSACWERFQQIDQELLPLSVENTNLKAYELSYDSAQKAVNRLEETLNALMNSGASNENCCKIHDLAMRVLVAALKIHALQAPHIAESSREKMDEIETTMQTQNALVARSWDALSFLMKPKSKPLIDAAGTAYAEFWGLNTEIIALSRQNSNVRSLAISLGRKRNATAECQDALAALEQAVQSKVYKATR